MKSSNDISKIEVKIERVAGCDDLPLPKMASKFASGIDLHCAESGTVEIMPGDWKLISTGIKIAIPVGYEGQIRPRSGLANKYGVTVLNSPGTIDADYRGLVKVILINHGKEIFYIKRGDRIAQLVFQKTFQALLIETKELDNTIRGEGGFGHSGVKAIE